MVPDPAPVRLAGNRWPELGPPEPGAWTPSRPVSVVIPCYQAPEKLQLTLAALAEQTYPSSLLQVVVADDGSEPPIAPEPVDGLDVLVVRQDRRGFGLARARNTGARAAEGEVLVFLDCDMVPEPGHVEAHARWHHLLPDAATIGFRRHLEPDGIEPDDVRKAAAAGGLGALFEDRRQESPEWIERHMERTDALTSDHDDLYRVVTGGNLGVRAELFRAVGEFDESFRQWGAEDTELGFRLFNAGAVLVPEREALCWHLGLGTSPDPGEMRSLEEQRAKLAHLIAHPGFRRAAPGRSFRVPQVVVRSSVREEPADEVLAAVEAVLAETFHDLVVCLSVPSGHPEATWLTRQLDGDHRVFVGEALDDLALVPHARLRLDLPAGLVVHTGTVAAMVGALDRARVGAVVMTQGEEPLRLWTTRALARARRLGAEGGDVETTVEELFGLRRLEPESTGEERGGAEARVRELERTVDRLRSRRVLRAADAVGRLIRRLLGR